jgi:uncharacterized protein with ParB-like and HNH nuclease domain
MTNNGIGITNINQEPISRILEDNNIYYVPYFQREYSWKIDDWRSLFEDIEKVRTSSEPHFFGFMTFRPGEENHVYIIEGQQRLSTITILLAVIRDHLYSITDTDWKELDRFINRRPGFKSEDLPMPKLHLSALNEEFFRSFVQKTESPENKFRSNPKAKLSLTNQLILGAYKYFYDILQEKFETISNIDNKTKYLSSLVEASTGNLIVITTNVSDELAAYNIFQTINGRGLDLTLTDLLKVYLFEKAGKSHTQEAFNRWDIMRSNLSSINTNAFLRHLWLSTRALVQEQKLLGEVKTIIKTSSQSLIFLEELKDESEVYDALLTPTAEYWDDQNIPALLEELQTLSTQQTLPLLLASANYFPTSDFKKLIKICISFVFRYQTIGEMENKEMERLFSGISIDIRKRNLKNSKEVALRMKILYPTDDAFKASFIVKTVKSRGIARYILTEIEHFLAGEKEKVAATISLEHILPINPDNEWKSFLKLHNMEKAELIYRLGNYTLLTKKVNKIAQNRFFDKKRSEWYQESDLKINIPLKTLKKWTTKEIQQRQEWMSNHAIKIWKI